MSLGNKNKRGKGIFVLDLRFSIILTFCSIAVIVGASKRLFVSMQTTEESIKATVNSLVRPELTFSGVSSLFMPSSPSTSKNKNC